MKIRNVNNGDCDYPTRLGNVYKAPERLYLRGKMGVLKKTCISVVGTRKCSEYGEAVCRKIVRELACLDVCIVSGLARGIDTIAHEVALECGLSTIAVLGSGLNNVYPRENFELANRIAENGLVVSEYEEGASALTHHFPQRNRIISGLSVATIVIEAPERSGALITARMALDQGREVFVVPGDIDRKNSEGCIKLLQSSGAYPIFSGFDVVEELKKQPCLFRVEKAEPEYNVSGNEAAVLKGTSSFRGRSIEQIKRKMQTALDINEMLAVLSMLEVKGLVFLKNGKYVRKF